MHEEDPQGEEMETHSNIPAWRIPCTKEPCGLQSMGFQKSDMTECTHTHTHTHPYQRKLCNIICLSAYPRVAQDGLQ